MRKVKFENAMPVEVQDDGKGEMDSNEDSDDGK